MSCGGARAAGQPENTEGTGLPTADLRSLPSSSLAGLGSRALDRQSLGIEEGAGQGEERGEGRKEVGGPVGS